MTKARDLATAASAFDTVTVTELEYIDGVTSAVQTQLDTKVSTAGGSTVTVASGTTVPLTIQNNGTGNSLVVNDVASDATSFVIDASGNVGIASTTAAQKLQIGTSGTDNYIQFGATSEGFVIGRENSSGDFLFNATQTSPYNIIKWQQNGTERMRIASDGTVTINAIADATTTTAARGAGYMGVPQSPAATTGTYVIVAADAGEHIYSTATRTITIPANASVAFPVGTAISFIAATGATVTIAINSDTLLLAGAGTTGSRTLAPFGMATALKITSTSWIISGNGLT